MKMFNVRLCLLIFVNFFYIVSCSIPSEILCVSPTCKEPISKALGSVTYASSLRNVLSFKPGQEITITSKSKNKNDYWGAIIDGRSGYVPSNLIKEVKIFHKFDDLIAVPVEALLQNTSFQTKDGQKSNLPESVNILNENTAKPLARDSGDNLDTPPPATVQTVSDNIVRNTVPQNIIPNVKIPEKPLAAATLPDSGLENDVPLVKAYNIIEGTTVYVDKTDQITPSPTVDVKSDPQTTVPVVEKKLDTPMIEPERATIPPEVINLNANYNGQLLMKQNNLTFENEDDEEDDEEDDFESTGVEDDEGDEEEIDENEELRYKTQPKKEENIFHASETATYFNKNEEVENTQNNNPTEKISEIPNTILQEKMKEKTIENTQQNSLIMQDVNEEAKENKTLPETVTVNVVENSVTSKISASIGTDFQMETEKKIEVDIPDHSSYSSSVVENSMKVSIQPNIEQLPTASEKMFSNENKLSDLKTNEPHPNVNVHPQNMYESNTYSQHIKQPQVASEPPNIVNENLVTTFSLPDNVEKENVNKDEQKPIVMTNEMTHSKIEITTEAPITDSPQLFENTITEPVTEIIKNEAVLSEESKEAVEATTKSHNIPSDVLSEVKEQYEQKPEEPGFFSQISGVVSSWFGSSEEKNIVDHQELEKDFLKTPKESSDEMQGDFTPENLNTISKEPHHKSSINSNGEVVGADIPIEEEQQPSIWNPWFVLSMGFIDSPTSSNTFLYLVVTAVTVLLFTLGHNFIEKKGKTGPLIAKINKLEQELLVTSKECCLLKDEVQSARDKIILYENSANDELVLSLQAELEESKKQKAELESSIEVLQQELDAATEAGLDLNKMLSEVLTQKGGSETLMESVERLQAQLDSQQKVIDEMTKKLGIKNQENEMLQTALETANEKSESLEEQLNDMKHNFNIHLKEKEDLTHDLKSQINQLQIRINQLGESKEKEILQFKKKLEEVQNKFSESTKALAIKEEEFKALKESIKNLKTKGNVNLETVFDVSRIKAELTNAQKESQALQVKLKEEENRKKSLEEKVKALDIEAQNLKKCNEEAELKKEEAEKKLEVLSNYFKEKETQLQKELGLQEALWAQKKGDEKSVYNMMKSLQEEVESYKSQNETLKKEILDQERGLKNQIATLEQKAYENWVAARQAERKLEENKQETAQLRNRLTLIEKNTNNNLEPKANHRTSEDLNGEPTSPVLHDTSSPLLFPPLPLDPGSSLLPPGFMPPPMFMPPPIGGFMPPPPFLPGDRRPPPLGRMSSPPLNSRFSPSSPADYPPFERMSSPPLSPPARNYRSPNEADRNREHFRHRTPPYPPLHHRNLDDSNEMLSFIPISGERDPIREHKGSNISSGHSSSDSIDKSSRHSGRV